MSAVGRGLAEVYPPPASLGATGATSLDLYRQSHTVGGASGQKESGLNNGIPLQVQAKICCDPWAVRRRFLHPESGLLVPALCGRYACLYCGPRRVNMWRAVVAVAAPERFVTFSRMGATLDQAARALTTVVQSLRRKGYRFEYFAVPERHKNLAFHWHLLEKGDYIPQAVLSDVQRSATHGLSYVCHIARAKGDVAGYATKYVTKSLSDTDVGLRPDGTRRRVNRVRYSRHFFPSSAAEVRADLREQWQAERAERTGEDVIDLEGSWVLQEVCELPMRPKSRGGGVDQIAADAQYRELVAQRLEDAGTEARKSSRADLVSLRFMLGRELESLGIPLSPSLPLVSSTP